MRLSLQLYTVRDHLEKDLEGTLKKVQATGLEYVELAGSYGRSASEWKTHLEDAGLKVSGSHIGIDRIKDEFESVVTENKTLDNPNVIVPWVDKNKYAGQWGGFGKELEIYGKRLAEAGLSLAYHNHAFEFEGDGFSDLYASSDPEYVKAELDLAWVSIGGADPVEWLQKLAGRVPLVHVKDYDPTKTPQWQPAGQGIMDFDAILPAAAAAGVKFAAVELDESATDPLDAVRVSVDFFHSKGLK